MLVTNILRASCEMSHVHVISVCKYIQLHVYMYASTLYVYQHSILAISSNIKTHTFADFVQKQSLQQYLSSVSHTWGAMLSLQYLYTCTYSLQNFTCPVIFSPTHAQSV